MTIEAYYNIKSDLQIPKTKVDFTKKHESNKDYSLKQERFGKVLNEVIQAKKSTSDSMRESGARKDVLEAADLEEVFTELEIEFDESLLFIQIGDESISIDQLLTTENVAELLSIDLEQLQQLLHQLGVEGIDINDIWTMIEFAPQLLQQMQIEFAQGNIAAEDAIALLEFIKLAELIGNRTDTVFSQQTQLLNMSEAFSEVLVQVLPALQQNTSNQQNQTQFGIFQQAVSTVAVEQKVEATTKSSTNTQNESLLQHNQQSNQLNRTVTVTLPTNQSSQAEAIAKEIANLLNRSQMSGTQGTIKLMLKLFPENLGQIRVEIMQQNGVMSARLLATTTAGKELLDSSLNQLKTTLAALNIQVDRLDVAQALIETDKNFRDQGMFSNFYRQRDNEEEEQVEEEEEQKSFEEYLTEEVKA